MKYQNPFHLAILVLTAMLLSACTEKPVSPEEEIRSYIKQGVAAAEERNTGDLMDLIHPAFQGKRNLDKIQLKQMLRGYFFRHKNIFLFTKIQQITLSSTQNAQVILYVAMAGSAISDASMLTSLRARIYRFELDLVKQDQWLLEKASWKKALASDMY